jgi:IclR family acetate operon transcriptional repressor
MATGREEKRQRGRPRSFHGPSDAGSIQSLDRAMNILALVSTGDGLSLSEVSTASGLPASTTYRMLTTLETHGMVEFDGTDQLWSVGAGAFRIGAGFLRRRRLADRSRTMMQQIMQQTGETANLGVAQDGEVVFISQVETHEAIRAFFRPGATGPLHASGIGKAILSHLPEKTVAAMTARNGLEAYTPATRARMPELFADLAAARQRGYALDDEERFVGMRCVAAAIFNEFDEPIAGISVSGPAVRVTREKAALFGPLVAEAAASITKAIGGTRPSL